MKIASYGVPVCHRMGQMVNQKAYARTLRNASGGGETKNLEERSGLFVAGGAQKSSESTGKTATNDTAEKEGHFLAIRHAGTILNPNEIRNVRVVPVAEMVHSQLKVKFCNFDAMIAMASFLGPLDVKRHWIFGILYFMCANN